MGCQQERVGPGKPGPVQQDPRGHRAKHLSGVLADHVQRNGVDQPSPSHDVNYRRPARGVLDRLGKTLNERGGENVPGLHQ